MVPTDENPAIPPRQQMLRIRGRKGEVIFSIILAIILIAIRELVIELGTIESIEIAGVIFILFLLTTVPAILFHGMVVEVHLDRVHTRRIVLGLLKFDRTLNFRDVRKVTLLKSPIGTVSPLAGKSNRIFEIRFHPRTTAWNVPITLSILHFSNKQLEQIEEIVNVLGESTRIKVEVRWRE